MTMVVILATRATLIIAIKSLVFRFTSKYKKFSDKPIKEKLLNWRCPDLLDRVMPISLRFRGVNEIADMYSGCGAINSLE